MGTRRRPPADVTVLGAGSALEGKLTARGAVQLDGAVSGELNTSGALSVSREARILGEVHAQAITVHGKIHGIVSARTHLQVLTGGEVRGHARYATLEVERGGIMDGSATRMVVDDSAPQREAAE